MLCITLGVTWLLIAVCDPVGPFYVWSSQDIKCSINLWTVCVSCKQIFLIHILPYNCVLAYAFYSWFCPYMYCTCACMWNSMWWLLSFSRFPFNSHITFGSHSSSQYLLASTTTHLLVWNMLTCTSKQHVHVACTCISTTVVNWACLSTCIQCSGVSRPQSVTLSQIPSALQQ